jgi:1D-myo-inositol-tetrakisphosphate 5-kinase/inositol-polyphosphate multikinase
VHPFTEQTQETIAALLRESLYEERGCKTDWLREIIDDFTTHEIVGKGYTGMLELENITHGMTRPCVIDVKLNCVGHDEQKRTRVMKKYAVSTSILYGFRITALQFYKAQDDLPTFYSKACSRYYDVKKTHERLGEFFRSEEHSGRPPVVDLAIAKIGEIAACLRQTCGFRFYSTSLLMAYDASAAKPVLRTKLIDFGRVAVVEEGGPDTVILSSLQHFTEFLEAL